MSFLGYFLFKHHVRSKRNSTQTLEGFIRDHILKHFIDNNLFNNNQYGFLKGRSTMLQLLRIMDEWTKCLESGGQINVIYTYLTYRWFERDWYSSPALVRST